MGAASPDRVSTPTGAVFLSYASQDAEASQKICEALRAAGIEVWFDKSELRGGDVWDRQIREKIHSCRLFIPIISANTESRDEGYFRREWGFATDRTRDIAEKRAFLIPVVIDDTPERGSSVPDKFHQIQWTRLPRGETPPAFVSRVAALLGAATPVATTAGPSPTGVTALPAGALSRRAVWIPLGFAALAVVIAGVWLTVQHSGLHRHAASVVAPQSQPVITEKSIAVLPFADMSEKHDQEYFADGMAEEIIERLSRVPELRVPGRASSFYFKGKSTKLSDIARELGVVNVVEGSVRKSGDHLRIGAQLVRVADGYTVWSESFDRKLSDVFKIQDEIATAIATALQITLSGDSLSREQGGTRNLEAYQLTLRARHDLNQNTVESLNRAIAQAERAVQLDPGYGTAWTNLAFAWLNLSDHGAATKSDACARVRESATQAIAVSRGLSTAHAALGYMYYECIWNWSATLLEVQRGLALDPNDGEIMNVAGELAMTLGRFDEAERSLRKALDRDPFQLFWRFNLASTLYLAGQYQQAEAEFRRLLEIAPDFGWARPWLAKTLLAVGKPREALAALEPIIDTDDGLSYLPEVLFANGRKAEAGSAAQRLEQTHGQDSAFFVAQYYAYVNDKVRALQWLERAYAQKDGWVVWIRGEPLMANLRDDSRFTTFLRKMNLPE
jgi:TolB-like protein/cytochrome c-type biogenesis protein CcmH/NrfG